jgi:hypothetical protein
MGTHATARRSAAALQQLHAHHRSHWFTVTPPSPSAAALAQPPSTHLVSVHNQMVYVRDSDEEAVALRPHPPALGRAAFVRHTAGGCRWRQASGCFEATGAGWRAAAAAGTQGVHEMQILEPNEGSFSVVAGLGIAAAMREVDRCGDILKQVLGCVLQRRVGCTPALPLYNVTRPLRPWGPQWPQPFAPSSAIQGIKQTSVQKK